MTSEEFSGFLGTVLEYPIPTIQIAQNFYLASPDTHRTKHVNTVYLTIGGLLFIIDMWEILEK